MSKIPRSFGQGALFMALAGLALTVSASGQGYPAYPNQGPSGYPSYPNNPQQSYPTSNYPTQSYPAQSYPAQSYPAQSSPAPNYPSRGYPAQSYPAAQSTPSRPVPATPVCVRLETQLAALDAGAAQSPLADQIKRAEDAIARQQADLDRTLAQARKAGCGQGFFSLFSGFSQQCGPLNARIDQMRGDLDRMMSDLEQLKSGDNDRQGQRTALIGQLAQNNCGAQYTQAARAAGPQGFFAALLGGGTIVNPGGNGAPAGTYRTVCVRSCDGYYFPISYSTVPSRFADDAQACQRLCPGAQVSLYTYHNPGEDIEQAVSIDGAPYSTSPNAFRYRKEVVPDCSCRRPGESWAQTLSGADNSSTLESGDIIVTNKNEKALTQVPQTAQNKSTPATTAPAAPTSDTVVTDPKNRKVRVVGPPFLSQQQQ